MNPLMKFWVPALIRVLVVLTGALIVGYVWGQEWFLITSGVGMLSLVGLQLHYLYCLSLWLDNPQINRLPDGWGAWTDIFSRLYKMRRVDEKNQQVYISDQLLPRLRL